MDLQNEFDRQVLNLLAKNYPKHSGFTIEKFLKEVNKLKKHLNKISSKIVDLEKGKLPFVVVTRNDLVSTNKAFKEVVKDGKSGIVKLYPLNPKDFKVINEIELPKDNFYLLIDIDRGKETLNTSPAEAFKIIKKKKESPLTIDEGVAIVTHYPEFLMKNNCFSLLASRNSKDKRVPAIWINANKEPNLGWCWEGNPHTWLGSASCKLRAY